MLSTADSSGRIQIIAPEPLGVVALSNTEKTAARPVSKKYSIKEVAKDVEVIDYDLTDSRDGEHLDISFKTPWDDFYAQQKEEVAKTEEEKRVCDMRYAGKGYIECMLETTMSNDEFRDFYQRLGDWETAHCVKQHI